MSECNHEWSTKYTKRFYADGVEWFCIHCHETLPWPDAKSMVNEHATLKQAIQAAIEYFTDGKTSKEQYDAYLRFVDAAQPFFAP